MINKTKLHYYCQKHVSGENTQSRKRIGEPLILIEALTFELRETLTNLYQKINIKTNNVQQNGTITMCQSLTNFKPKIKIGFTNGESSRERENDASAERSDLRIWCFRVFCRAGYKISKGSSRPDPELS